MTDEELAIIRNRAESLDQDESWSATPSSWQGDVEQDLNQIVAEDVPKLVDEVERLREELLSDEVARLRAKIHDRDDELRFRDQEDAESEDMEQRPITADRRRGKAQAEVARLQGIIDRVRVRVLRSLPTEEPQYGWDYDPWDDPDVDPTNGEDVRHAAADAGAEWASWSIGTGILSILDGEEQS